MESVSGMGFLPGGDGRFAASYACAALAADVSRYTRQ